MSPAVKAALSKALVAAISSALIVFLREYAKEHERREKEQREAARL